MEMDLDEERMATMLSGMIAEVDYKDGDSVLNAVSKLQNDEHNQTAIVTGMLSGAFAIPTGTGRSETSTKSVHGAGV